ncbi:MAG: DUF1194 domain-containing protein [Geminicoccaceae bacterium]
MHLRALVRRAALLVALIAPAPAAAQEDKGVPVDLELVLAVDISGSIDEIEARLQREGYVRALGHPDVIQAIRSGMFGRIAVTYVEWANDEHQQTVIGWTLVSDLSSAQAMAGALAEAPMSSGRWTSISGAVDYAARLFDHNGYQGFRRVIDVSGDGYNNRGRPVEWARDDAVAAGITINGLPIMNGRSNPWGGPPPADLDLYYEERVIGGPGAFIVVAQDFSAFASAILNKLLLEIAGNQVAPDTGVSARRPIGANHVSRAAWAALAGGDARASPPSGG